MGPRRLVEYMCGAFDFVVFKVLLVPFSALASKRPATEAWEFRGGGYYGAALPLFFSRLFWVVECTDVV